MSTDPPFANIPPGGTTTTKTSGTTSAAPTVPSVGTAPASTRPRRSAPKIPPYVSQFAPPNERCDVVFGALEPNDKAAICGALNTADENIQKLASAIGEYATSLIDDRKVLQQRLDAALEQAKEEKEATGSVSASTTEEVQEVAAEYVATDGKVKELESKLDAYRKLPGIIGKYNTYFGDLVATLQGARGPQQTGQGAPAPPASSAPKSPSVPLEPPASQSAQAGVGQVKITSQMIKEKLKERKKKEAASKEDPIEREKRERKMQESRERREKAAQAKRQPTQLTETTLTKLEGIMRDLTLRTPQRIANMRELNTKVQDERLQALLRSWIDIYSAISETRFPDLNQKTKDDAPEIVESLIAGKNRFAQQIRNLDDNVQQVDEYKALLLDYLDAKYDRHIQQAKALSGK